MTLARQSRLACAATASHTWLQAALVGAFIVIVEGAVELELGDTPVRDVSSVHPVSVTAMAMSAVKRPQNNIGGLCMKQGPTAIHGAASERFRAAPAR
jgi:hypothetical protein